MTTKQRQEQSRAARILARQVADIAAEASLDGLDAVTALMTATIHVCFDSRMSKKDIANWFFRMATEFDEWHKSETQTEIRRRLREEQSPTKGAKA